MVAFLECLMFMRFCVFSFIKKICLCDSTCSSIPFDTGIRISGLNQILMRISVFFFSRSSIFKFCRENGFRGRFAADGAGSNASVVRHQVFLFLHVFSTVFDRCWDPFPRRLRNGSVVSRRSAFIGVLPLHDSFVSRCQFSCRASAKRVLNSATQQRARRARQELIPNFVPRLKRGGCQYNNIF